MVTNKKHLQFIDEYFLRGMNGTDAYQAVYPKSSRESARRDASRLLTNADVQAEIRRRLIEKHMSADEVLARLADHARGDIKDFLKFYDGVNTPFLDLPGANERGLLHLVKKLKYNKAGQPEIELYDAQAALQLIGKAHGLFKDVQEHSGTVGTYGMTLEQWQAQQRQNQTQVSDALADFEESADE